ncbi:MAG: RagB/SusD family nutrient uptake outer membrane protein, partial [Tannerella sp.]|nr:RagB/SusD family nutrient uptake outer membrane protein [Tannerella sp.]
NQKATWAPPLHIVEQFYTKNGIPIEDDRDWVGVDPMALRTATSDERLLVKPAAQTLQLHFDREPRFYASITFVDGRYFGNSRITDGTESNSLWYTTNPIGLSEMHSSTGYVCKKMVGYQTTASTGDSDPVPSRYPFPLIRLADIYLMYAEALNEAGGDTPSAEVYYYVDTIRRRSGLKDVVESWKDHAIASKQDRPLSKAGMRDIIRQERMIELAFEGIRFWDLRRWLLSEDYMNRTIRGFDIYAEDFYQPVDIFQLKFEKKDYFWPIRQSVLMRNTNLMQNPEWGLVVND